MSTRFEDFAASLTARKGNHPVLWIIFGVAIAATTLLTIVRKETFIPIPRLWRALQGMPSKRFEEVSWAAEPFLFCLVTLVFVALATFCLSVGIVSLRYRVRAKREPHPLSGIVSG